MGDELKAPPISHPVVCAKCGFPIDPIRDWWCARCGAKFIGHGEEWTRKS